jgi:tetratricopeptide (TPR) repeat protein
MKHIFLLIIFLSISLESFAGPENATVNNEILNALNDVYNLKFDEAEKKFKSISSSDPDNPQGYFYESLIYFYKALPSRDEKLFNKYIDLSDKVIEISEDALDKNENDYDALYYKGMSHSYRSLLMLSLNKNLLKAASNGSDGYKILTALVQKKPDYYDAYMGLGLYKIAIGFVPEKFQWLLTMIGFEGNIKEGRSLLQRSLENGVYTKVDSKVFLTIFSLREKEEKNDQSILYSRELTEQYPESPVFKVFYSSMLLQNGSPEEAVQTAEDALSINKYSFQDEIIKSANAVLGTAYFRLNQYQKAAEHLEIYMKYVNREDRYNLYLFTLGVSYELSGDRTKALEKYKMVRNDFNEERDGELDKFFYRLAQDKIKTPFRDIDIELVKALNLKESGRTDEAIEIYLMILNNNIASKYKSDDEMIKVYYDLGVAYAGNDNPEKAKEYFSKCIVLNPENEKWLVPHSYFELGKIYYKNGNSGKGVEMFEKVYDYDNFDFESFLDMRMANYKN